jgi:branched-chain amino acid transport system substrate-binding protein
LIVSILALYFLPSALLPGVLLAQGILRAESTELKIGLVSNLSGEGAAWGVNHLRGSELAAKEWNAKGGVAGKQIRLLVEDSPGGLARSAVNAYQRLRVQHGIQYLLGPLMGDELQALAPLVQKDRVVVVGATWMPELPENFFSTWIDARAESRLIAERIAREHSRVAVLGSTQSWERLVADSVKEALTKQNVQVLAYEAPAFDSPEVRAEVLRVSRSKPSAIFISSYFLLPHYLRGLSTLKSLAEVYSIELDQSVIDHASESAEGLTFLGPTPPRASFVEAFKSEFGTEPDIPAAHAYDAAQALFHVLDRKPGGAKEAIEMLRALVFEGATGTVLLGRDPEGVIERTRQHTAWYRVKRGRVVPEGFSGAGLPAESFTMNAP